MNRKRTKLIRIRVSEEQFQALEAAREQEGSRSISDLALETMRKLIESPAAELLSDQSSLLWNREFTSRLISLQAEVERLEILLNVKK